MIHDPRWAIDGTLARSCRPGYPGSRVGQATVDDWLAAVRAMGIGSILCLLSDEQLAYYGDVRGGLVGYYREQGLSVVHIPIDDPAYHPEGLDQLRDNRAAICQAFDRLPKPVVVHCSAGIDRTGHAVQYIQSHLDTQDDAE